jgi:hypothetical protein
MMSCILRLENALFIERKPYGNIVVLIVVTLFDSSAIHMSIDICILQRVDTHTHPLDSTALRNASPYEETSDTYTPQISYIAADCLLKMPRTLNNISALQGNVRSRQHGGVMQRA